MLMLGGRTSLAFHGKTQHDAAWMDPWDVRLNQRRPFVCVCHSPAIGMQGYVSGFASDVWL